MTKPTSHFSHHVFFCGNQRTDGRPSCQDHGAAALRDYCKVEVAKRGLTGAGRVRINMAGCLDRCDKGPVAVVYPEGVWYQYANKADIDEIIESHLVNGQAVKRLQV